MRLSKRHASKIVFLIVLLLSMITLGKATVNYVGVHVALNSFELRALDIDLITNQENLSVTVDLEVSNPTWYDGLYLQSIISTLSYEGENHTVIISPGGPRIGTPYQAIITRWWELPETENIINRPLTPYAVLKTRINLTMKAEDSIRFREFYEKQGKYQEFVLWTVTSRVYLSVPTFLNSIGLEYQFYLKS